MSVGPLGGLPSSIAATPLAQKGTEAERAQQDANSQDRRVQSQVKAENAAGIGETDGDHEASDRDADGRRIWEKVAGGKSQGEAGSEPPGLASRDASGQSGNLLDLSG